MNKTLYQFSSVYKKHKKCQNAINEIIDNIIEKKINEINQNVDDRKTLDTENDVMGRKTKPVIEILLERHHEMSYEQIRDELITILIGNI